MSIKQISTGFTCVVLATAAISAQADAYWQAPDWSGYNQQPPANYQQQNYPPQNYQYRPRPQQQSRPANPYAGQQNMNRGNVPPPPAGPYASQYGQPQAQPQRAPQNAPVPHYNQGPYYGPNSGASAYNMPGYNPYRRSNNGWSNPWGGNNRWGNNRWDNNRFWGRSGPSKWMSPSKDNWENSWDDMINAPSRMGDMPGGWTAPEVTMPNPIDMGDQMQENVQDLPDQMKNMDVGNDVN